MADGDIGDRMNDEFNDMNVPKLRRLVRDVGWTGASVLCAKREDLLTFLRTGNSFSHFKFQHIGELIAVLGAVPESPIPETASTFQGRRKTGGKVGKPAPAIPANIEPLLKTIGSVFQEGFPFCRTGKQGIYNRRHELPHEWWCIGRDRLEAHISALVLSGEIMLKDGKLSVADIHISGTDLPEDRL